MTKHMPFQRTIVMLVALGLGIAGLSTPSWGGAALLYHNLEDTPAPTVPGIHVDPEGEIRFMRWYPPQLPVPMYFNDQAIPGRPAAQVFAVLSESLDRWTRVPESSFAWRNAGTTPITNAALDGVNVFTFVDFNIIPPNSPILGVTMWNFTRTPDANGPEGHFIDVDIVFSPFELWGLDDNTPPGQFNLLAVAVHELGHALGLSHHPNMGGIMFPVYQQAEVGQPFPFPDDSSIMSLLYPQDPPLSTAFGTIKGHVKDEAGNPIWNAWITAVREDGTRNPDGFDSVGAWSLLKGEYTLKRVPPGRYWLQMGPLVPSIRGNDTGLGGYGVYGSTFFNLLDRLNNVVGFVRVRRDYPVEWFDNIAEANANQPPFGATVLEVRAGQVYENIDFVVGIELPALPDVEPNNNFAEAILTTYGEVKAGRIDPIPAGINPDVDFYAFDAAVGDLFVVDVTALTPLLLPSPLKPRLTLYDPDGVVIVVRDAVGSEVLIPYRSPRAGRYYAKLEDQRGLGFGGPDYVYRLEVDLAVAHRLPEETNLLAPAKGPAAQDSEPVAVVGLDLVDNYGDAYGDAYISKVVAHFSNFSNRQMITPADFVPVALNELSGVSLWRDVNGDGSYNYTRGVRNDDDEFIPLSDIVVIPEPDGFTVEMYPQVAPDGTGSRARLPGLDDGGRFDYFVVIRPSDLMQHGESFIVQIPVDGLTVIDQFTPIVVNTADPLPALPQTLICDIVQYVVFTDPQNIDNFDWPGTGYFAHPLEVGRPELIFGLNTWGNKGEGYRISKLTVDLRNVLDFEPGDLAFLNNTEDSGVSLYVDKPGTADGVFEVELDERVPLKFPETRIRKATDDAGTYYEVVLVPETPLEVPDTDLASQSTENADFFLALRLSGLVRDGDLLRVETAVRGQGPVVFTEGSSTRRVLNTGTRPQAHLLRISPQPEFKFTSLVKPGDTIGRESRSRAVIGINVQDYGAHYTNLGQDTKIWFDWLFDSIRVDFLDDGVPGNFTLDDLRPLNNDVGLDVYWGEPLSGVALYRDDNTGLANQELGSPGWDPDDDGRVGEELHNNMDDDLDGLTDEDIGDFDAAGIKGQFDEFDDYIPFTVGRMFTTNGPSIADFNRYFTGPTASQLPTGTGFSVNFTMRILRRELHFCGDEYVPDGFILNEPYASGRADVLSDIYFAYHAVLAGEHPLFVTGFGGFTQMLSCTSRALTGVGAGVNFVATPHENGVPDDPCNHQVVVTGPPLPCTNRSGGEPVIQVTYVHGIEIPDDDFVGGPNDGDDFYVVLRTSSTLSNGDDFAVRIAPGGIRYSRYESPAIFNLTPRANRHGITTPLLRADVKIQARLTDLTSEGQFISPGALDEDPFELFGLNMDLGGSREGVQPGVSPERLSGFILEIFSPAGTPADQRVVVSNDAAISHFNPIGPGANSGILFFEDHPTGSGRDGVFDPQIDPRVDVKADPEITGSGTVGDPYRIRIELDRTVSVYYDDFTGQGQFTNGDDFFVAVRASANMKPGTRFVARLRAPNFSGTTALEPVGPSGVETNVIRAAVPTQILSRIESQREIVDANLSPRVNAFAINVRDDGTRQRLDSLKVQLIPVQPSRFPRVVGVGGQSIRSYTLPGHPPQITVLLTSNLGQGDVIQVVNPANVNAILAQANGPSPAGGSNITVNVVGDTFAIILNNVTGGANYTVLDVREFGQPAIPRGANSEFTLSDLASLSNSMLSGLALYKDVNVGPISQNAVFDASDELVPMLPPVASGLDVTLRFLAPYPDVPDTDLGLDSGADYFLVFRTSSSINIGDAFAVAIPRNGLVFANDEYQSPSPAGNSTAVVWANRRFVPSLVITRPLTPLEPGDPSYTIQWEDDDPDNDGPTVALYYIPEVDIGQPTGTRTLIVENLPAIPDGIFDRFTWPTTGLPRGEYRIIGIIQDNAGNVVEATSPGTILLASDVANITITAPALTQTEEQRTAIGGRYRIRWTDNDEDANSRLRLFWDADTTPDDPRGVQMNFISGNINVLDKENSFLWTIPVAVMEQYPQIQVGYVQTDPDLDLPIIRYADAPVIIRAATPSVSVDYAFNLADPQALREALARQTIPVRYVANDIDSNGPNTASVNMYYVDASLIGPATGKVTLALLDELAANGQYLRSTLGVTAVDLPEDPANGGLVFDWDISTVPSGTYGIIATVTDREVISDADLVYATAPAFLTIPPLRFPSRFLFERFEQSSALATDFLGAGETQTLLFAKSGRLLVLTKTGLQAFNRHLLPTADSGQVVSSPAAGDFDVNRPGTELVVGVSGSLGPSLLFVATDSEGHAATRLIPLDDSPLKPGVDSTPAVGDLNGDGEMDVVVKLRNGKIVSLAGDGAGNFSPLWSVDSAAQATLGLDGSPAIGNVRGDGDLEVVVGTADGKVLVIETLPQLSVTTLFSAPMLGNAAPQVFSSPALYDIDGDGLDEIFIGVATSLRGALYGLNGDATSVETLSVVTKPGQDPGTVLAVSDVPDTAPARSLLPIRVSPAFGDVSGDGRPDLVFASERYLYAYSFRPTERAADLLFYREAPNYVSGAKFTESSPILADLITGEGAQEIVIGAGDQLLILTYVNGQVKNSVAMSDPSLQERLAFDLTGPGRIATTPLIADAVGDPLGQLELVLVVAAETGGLIDALDAFDGTLVANRNVSWPMLKCGPSRTARFGETEAKTNLPFDLNKDGVLDYRDLILFGLSWSATPGDGSALSGAPRTDFNKSGRVDADDLYLLIDVWTRY